LYAQNLCSSSQKNAKKRRTTTTPRKHASKSSLLYFSITTLIFLYWKQRQVLKKPLQVSQNHSQHITCALHHKCMPNSDGPSNPVHSSAIVPLRKMQTKWLWKSILKEPRNWEQHPRMLRLESIHSLERPRDIDIQTS
jgi:hypothetical protein